MAKIIKGLNCSKAIKDGNGNWFVIGAHDVLDEQEDTEFAYKIAETDIKTVLQLNADTPVYAGVNSFENNSNETADYVTVNDLIELAKEMLKDIQNAEHADFNWSVFNQLMRRKNDLVNNQTAIEEIANAFLDQLTWQQPTSYFDELEEDVCEQPDAYEALFEPINENRR